MKYQKGGYMLPYYENILSEITPYLKDGKNSLIIFLGDKYSGKTELLTYLHNNFDKVRIPFP